ncbi:MAG TPA: TetR family transcriptional regulator [Solirubrobacterales bacterium]|nr:TetR family transcriptional regulator [Solirubrobacterales bacterium]
MTETAPTERLLRNATAGPESPIEDATTANVIDAALHQFELFGLARTTMDDIARRAKVSRVTIYRRFAGKDALVDAVILRELRRFLADLDSAIAPLATPEEKLVEGFVFTLDALRRHRLLQRMLESEPELVLPHLTLQGGAAIAAAREFLAIGLARELPDDRGGEELLTVADIVVRLILSFVLAPQTTVDLDDPEVARDFARRYLQPILIAA